MTIARHNLNGRNRFGQDAAEYPFCLLNLAAWKECGFDLRVTNWFRSREEATSYAEGRIDVSVEAPAASNTWSAVFSGGVQVELRSEHGRWLMWFAQDGKTERRRDFSSPSVEHAKRTAEHWFGTPVKGWSAGALASREACE